MTIKQFLTIGATLAVLFGLGFVLAPESSDALYGVPAEAHNILTTRYFGATLLQVGSVYWFLRQTSDRAALRGALMSLVIGSLIGAIVSIFGTLAATVNAMGWTSVVVYLLLSAGAVYFLTGDRMAQNRG